MTIETKTQSVERPKTKTLPKPADKSKPSADNILFEPKKPEPLRRSPIIAEDIARFRIDVTSKLMSLPLSEWPQAYEQTISGYPQIEMHKQHIDYAFHSACAAGFTLNLLWDSHHLPERKETKKIFNMDVADSQASVKLFKSIFGKEPQDDLKVLKGQVSLWFFISPQDYLKAMPDKDKIIGNTNDAAAITRKIPGYFFSVVLFPKTDKSEIEDASHITIKHEAEHCIYHVLKLRNQLISADTQTGDDKIKNRLIRRAKEADSFYDQTKNELLAYFSAFDILDYSGISDSPDEINKFFQIVEVTSKAAINQLSYPENYTYSPHQTPPDQKELNKKAQSGWDSLFQLLNFYLSNKIFPPQYCPARMTLNVLEQFPLQSWPAAVRLIKSSRENQIPQKSD